MGIKLGRGMDKRCSILCLTILLIVIAMGLYSCKWPTDSLVDYNKKYVWTIDTLYGNGAVPWSIWGNSPQNVWAVGFNYYGLGEIFHYTGKSWERVTPNLGFNYELISVLGFSDNDIYVAGSKLVIDTALHSHSLILHYNGSGWSIENIPDGGGLRFMHGRNANDIWACGINGALYHKSATTWTKIPFSKDLNLGPIFESPTGEVYLMSEYYNYPITGDTAMFYFSKYTSNAWTILDSCRLVNIDGIPTGYKFGNNAMWGGSANEIYSIGDAVYKFDGNKWEGLGGYGGYFLKDIKGTSRNNIYLVGEHGTIGYYNGSNWSGITEYSKYLVDFYSIMPFEKEFFIGAYAGGTGMIIHGKIK